MSDLLIFGLLFVAVAIGWVLGRRSVTASPVFPYHRRAYDRPLGVAIDKSVEALAVKAGSARSRIAMGIQLRRRGEVDGAVRIHQALLAGPGLAADDLARARLELARDYISAGLLDRAEALLQELVREFPAQREVARGHLLDLYEAERDWRRATDVAKALLPRKLRWQSRASESSPERGQGAALRFAHYCCELAEEARGSGDTAAARRLLLQALVRDRRCVRAAMSLGQLDHDCGRYRQAVLALRRVRAQDPDYLPETLGLLRRCYEALGDRLSLREYLAESLALRPTPALVAAVAEELIRAEGSAAAGDFLAVQLPKYPSLPGLLQLIGLQVGASAGRPRDDLALLQDLAGRLQASRPSYRCGHCGFAGKHLHWHCPGCKYWGSIKAIDAPGTP